MRPAVVCLLLVHLACTSGEDSGRRELEGLAQRRARLGGLPEPSAAGHTLGAGVRGWGPWTSEGTSEGTSREEEAEDIAPVAGMSDEAEDDDEPDSQGGVQEQDEEGSGEDEGEAPGGDAASEGPFAHPPGPLPPVDPWTRVDLLFKFETSSRGVPVSRLRSAIAAGVRVPVDAVTIVRTGRRAKRKHFALIAIQATSKEQALKIRDSMSTPDLERELRKAGVDARITSVISSVNGEEAPKRAPETLYFIALAAPVLLATYIAFRMCRGRPKQPAPRAQVQHPSSYGNIVIPTAVAVASDVPVALPSRTRRDGEVVLAVPVPGKAQDVVSEYPSAVPSAPVLPISIDNSMQTPLGVPVAISNSTSIQDSPPAVPVAGSASPQEVPDSVASFPPASLHEQKA